MKKIIFIFGVLFVLNAQAESCTPDNLTCFECGTNCTMKLTYETDEKGNQVGTLTVSGTGAMKNYGYHSELGEYGDFYSRPWASIRNSVQNIKIEEGITTVGSNTFIDFSNLKNVELADSVTKLEGGAFQTCRKLDKINIGDNITYIGNQALEGTALTSLVIPENTNLNSIAFYLYDSSAKIATLYCSENNMAACEAAIAFRGDNAKVVGYEKRDDGKYEIGGKIYENFDNMMGGKYMPRRIYSVEDASRFSKPTGNKIMLRYK